MKKKIIRGLVVAAIIVIAFVLQTVFSKLNSHLFVTPNFLLIVACMFGFMKGSNYGSVIGLICGLLVDVSFCDVIGLNALIFMFCGFFSGTLKKLFYSDHIFMPMLIVFTNDFIYNIAIYIFRFLLRNKQDFSFYFGKVILPEMVITTFIVFLLYKVFYILNEKVFVDKEESILSFDK